MGTLPGKTTAKLRRPITDSTDIASISSAQIDWDDDNNMTYVEEIALDPGDEAAMQKLLSSRVEEYEQRRERLDPSDFAAFGALSDALDPHMQTVQARLSSERNTSVLLAVKVPDLLWCEAFTAAAKTAFAAIALASPAVDSEAYVSVPEHDRWNGGTTSFPLEKIASEIRKRHVVVLYAQNLLPPSVLPMVDVSLDLNAMSAEYLKSAVARHFSVKKTDVGSWAGTSVSDVSPNLFDSACDRAVSARAVRPLVVGFTVAAAQERAAALKSAKATSVGSKASGFEPEILHPTSPLIDELHGLGDIAVWGHQFADDVKLVIAGKLGAEDVDRGVLIEGPPGTGKTMLMQAIAATAGIAFLPTSFAIWQAQKGGHLGDVINAIRKVFEVAAKNAPCIIFIDEMDAIPKRGQSKYHDDYWRPIVNALLECLDGTARREGVYVFAATNDASVIDPAILRSGRLDRRFTLGLPDEEALRGIINYHLPDLSTDVIEPVATALAGSVSGADISRIAREARRTARRADRPLTPADLLDIAIPPDHLSETDRRLVAVHEAGHAIVVMHTGRVPQSLSIVTVGQTHGGVAVESGIRMGRLRDYETAVMCLLAGRAAEEMVLGEPSAGAEGDLRTATGLVAQLMGTTGLSGRLLHSEQTDGHAVEARLRDLYARTMRVLGEHRSAVERLADLALQKRVIGHAALLDFAKTHGFVGGVR